MCSVLGRLHDGPYHARRRLASETRQGTKARDVGGAVPRALWGFRLDDEVGVGLQRLDLLARCVVGKRGGGSELMPGVFGKA